MLPRTIFSEEHELFRSNVRRLVDAAKVRLVASNLHFRAADECLQLFGGSG